MKYYVTQAGREFIEEAGRGRARRRRVRRGWKRDDSTFQFDVGGHGPSKGMRKIKSGEKELPQTDLSTAIETGRTAPGLEGTGRTLSHQADAPTPAIAKHKAKRAQQRRATT